ncbi:hypothetical protein NDQ41_01930 [Alcaligenes faecalis]|uniref:hypothetical protein n=2 Tax=Alcaligenes faecalis TaxID=511 RepID=UPI00203DCB25|nr:hypothetical protein [Alcaligenes faecalis]MCM2557460.1 hypothetical protein [Alcaligenes faecalis]MCM2620397.1 hypothetical protein [Alcaligenes faecalis]
MPDISAGNIHGNEEGSMDCRIPFLRVMEVMGLDSPKLDMQARSKKRGLMWMAAKTVSVNYAQELASETLE